MIKGEYRKILYEVFDVLGFFESEKEEALEGFKRKFANELLKELWGSFTEDQQKWLNQTISSKNYDKNHFHVAEMQKIVDSTYPSDKLDELSRRVFKKILESYVNFMSQKVDNEKGYRLRKALNDF